MCFDKTGTLTKDSLDLYGLRYVAKPTSANCKFEHIVYENIHENLNIGDQKLLRHRMLELMATCHSLTNVKGVVAGKILFYL